MLPSLLLPGLPCDGESLDGGLWCFAGGTSKDLSSLSFLEGGTVVVTSCCRCGRPVEAGLGDRVRLRSLSSSSSESMVKSGRSSSS